MEVKGITVHNTNNELSAQENIELMKQLNAEGNMVSVHYFVDNTGYYQATSEDVPTWHTGKGYDAGNMNTISIEICSKGSEEEYKQAEENACFLIRILMSKYELRAEDIYFHRDFDTSFYCPHRILDKYFTEDYPKQKWIENNKLNEYSDYLESNAKRKERLLRRR